MPAKYRADHIGSLLRPAELLQARNTNSDTAQLRALEDKHILRVIERQKDLGFKIFTDGELRRGNFMSDFNDAVEGIDEGVAVARTWQTGTGPSSRPSMVPGTVVGKIKQTRRLTGHEFAFVKQHSPGDVKVTLPTVNQFPAIYYKKGISDKVYPTYSDFLSGYRADRQGGDRSAGQRRSTIRADRRAALQLLHRSEMAQLCKK